MAPNNTTTKMSVDFDLTDIEDIDAISDEFDADPSSDDDTFISNKNKKITKKREKRINIVKNNINNNNGTQIIEKYEKIITKMEKQVAPDNISSTNFNTDQLQREKSDESEDEKEENLGEKRKTVVLALNGPTDHFNELEKEMNGPGWMITSSSASESEDELGALERDEFSFKMCQVIRRNGKNQEKRKKHHLKHEKIVRTHSEDTTTTKTETTSTTEVQASEDSSDGENMLKYCSRSVPLAALNEDEL